MTESKNEAKDTLRNAMDGHSEARGVDQQDNAEKEKLVETYDALDYRLMATFPASDATAKY